LGSTQGFGPKTYDPYNILNPKGNGVNVKSGTRTNPKQHYTKINVHNIEKNMCHLNFDNYPRENDEFLVINRQVTLASNNGVSTYQWLTSLQISLDTYGTFDQGLGGFITGIASGMIDVYRGNYVDAVISLLSATPVVGIVGDMWKAERNVTKVAKALHGNSLLSTKPTWGYKLFSKDDTFLKNGITSSIDAEKRYTKEFMMDKFMKVEKFPTRMDAYQWEYYQNMINPGPLNNERYLRRKNK
ncbi:MAG TPA: hypothetical protein PLE30_11470, partial [Candidatus Kapabacteria bacterium]|nr:hypothetical protein [Candidatus Kapabacteria bacterium]